MVMRRPAQDKAVWVGWRLVLQQRNILEDGTPVFEGRVFLRFKGKGKIVLELRTGVVDVVISERFLDLLQALLPGTAQSQVLAQMSQTREVPWL